MISTLRSASSLNRENAWFSASPWTRIPIFSSVSAKAWRPECLPSTIWRPICPTSGGVDDLVGAAVGEHPVLVDARLVGEGVAPDHGLVVLDRDNPSTGSPAERSAQAPRSSPSS